MRLITNCTSLSLLVVCEVLSSQAWFCVSGSSGEFLPCGPLSTWRSLLCQGCADVYIGIFFMLCCIILYYVSYNGIMLLAQGILLLLSTSSCSRCSHLLQDGDTNSVLDLFLLCSTVIFCFFIGTMEILLLKALLDSITKFGHVSSSSNVKPALVQKYCQIIDQILEHFKSVCDEIAASEISLDEQLVKGLGELDALANEARELVMSWYPMMSKIYFVS